MTSVAKCLGHAETKGTVSFALARRPFFLAARCRATLISSSVRCDAILSRVRIALRQIIENHVLRRYLFQRALHRTAEEPSPPATPTPRT